MTLQKSPSQEGEEREEKDRRSSTLILEESGISGLPLRSEMDGAFTMTKTQMEPNPYILPTSFEPEHDVDVPSHLQSTCGKFNSFTKSEVNREKLDPTAGKVLVEESSSSGHSHSFQCETNVRKMSSTSSAESTSASETPSIKSEDTQGISSCMGALPQSLAESEYAGTNVKRDTDSPLTLDDANRVGINSSGIDRVPSLGTSEPQHTPASESPPPAPVKSLRMKYLHKKYHAELEYMLVEFRKLESQLLGAKGNGTGVQESAGSRERREKLHSFIVHLEDTIRQMEAGVQIEPDGKTTVISSLSTTTEAANEQVSNTDVLAKRTSENEEEENVHKLEEHILANLLPVKVRLKKQLAAQQGATRNPVGMPTARRGMLQPPAANEKGTFAIAAEQKLIAAEATRLASERQEGGSPIASLTASSHFGKPIGGGGSSLTQKLYGSTLASRKRPHGCGVESSCMGENDEALVGDTKETLRKRKVLYGGMAPGSEQVQSGVSAAAGAHEMIIERPTLVKSLEMPDVQASKQVLSSCCASIHSQTTVATTGIISQPPLQEALANTINVSSEQTKIVLVDSPLSGEERKRLRKLRRNKKKRRDEVRREKERQRQALLQQQAIQAQIPKVVGKKGGKTGMLKMQGKKKGPRAVEYICALCSETYGSTCEHNPWWTLTSHECPKCRKSQVPRVDITSPANAIEYHPALLAHADDISGSGISGGPQAHSTGTVIERMKSGQIVSPEILPANQISNRKFLKYPPISMSDSEDSDFSDLSDGPLSDFSGDSDDSEDLPPLSAAEHAENENYGHGYCGPVMVEVDAKRLLVLIGHASSCPGRHKNAKQRDVCNSTKFLMLHVRDCPGTTSSFDVCPFPWCRKVKHLLFHLLSCENPKECFICNQEGLSTNLAALSGLTDYRRKKHNERVKVAMTAAVVAAKTKPKHLVSTWPPWKPPPVPPGIAKQSPCKPMSGGKFVPVRQPPPPLRPGLKVIPLSTSVIKPFIPSSALRPAKTNVIKPTGYTTADTSTPGAQSTQQPCVIMSSTPKIGSSEHVSKLPSSKPSTSFASGPSGLFLACAPQKSRQDCPSEVTKTGPVLNPIRNAPISKSPLIVPMTSLEKLPATKLIADSLMAVNSPTLLKNVWDESLLVGDYLPIPDVQKLTACLKANFESAAATLPTQRTTQESSDLVVFSLRKQVIENGCTGVVAIGPMSGPLQMNQQSGCEDGSNEQASGSHVTQIQTCGSHAPTEVIAQATEIEKSSSKCTTIKSEVEIVDLPSTEFLTKDDFMRMPAGPVEPFLLPTFADNEHTTSNQLTVACTKIKIEIS